MESMATMPTPMVPRAPETLREAGIPEELVAGLVIKALHQRGSAAGFELADLLALPFAVLDGVIEQLQERRFIQVTATNGPTRGEYVLSLAGEGRRRAAEELALSRYVGPAPIPFEDFCRWIELQTIARTRVSAPDLQQALEGMVLPDAMLELLGPAINSSRSLFLYGDSGNGKTLLARRLARAFGDRYYVPYSVLVDGSIMVVYDPITHGSDVGERAAACATRSEPWAEGAFAEAASNGAYPHNGHSADVLYELLRPVSKHDRRFVEVRRPVVITGGELTLEQLDLQWDRTNGMYQAPPQLKAAGGVLVVDDLGRQRVEVHELLNRWGVPLENRQDHLTLASGRKLVVPFDCFVIFSTNLQPRELADDAFMRRIHYKIEVADPDREEYEQIFRSCCNERGIAFDPASVEYLFGTVYRAGSIAPRRCHPRDILDHVRDLAEYRGVPASLERALLERACRSYFLLADRHPAATTIEES